VLCASNHEKLSGLESATNIDHEPVCNKSIKSTRPPDGDGLTNSSFAVVVCKKNISISSHGVQSNAT